MTASDGLDGAKLNMTVLFGQDEISGMEKSCMPHAIDYTSQIWEFYCT